MKVLFVVTELEHPLKMNSFIYSQGESLRQMGIDVTYFFLTGRGPSKYLFGIFKINQEVKKKKYDLIHGHYSFNSYVASFQKKVPIVASFLGSDILRPNKGLFGVFNAHVNARVKSSARYFIYKTKEMAKVNRMEPFSIIPNGVNLETFRIVDKTVARKKIGLDPCKKYVLFASDPAREEKNFSLVEKAMTHIQDKTVELLIVKNVDQDRLNLYYNACDVLVVSSLREGSINTVKEALAVNLPVVAVDVGDIRQHSRHVGNVIITSRDSSDFAKDVLNVLSRGEKYNSRDYIETNLSVGSIAEKISNIYNRVLSWEN
nr:glycosyltransferase family 4 protein [uncultured Desulfobacter sp.]